MSERYDPVRELLGIITSGLMVGHPLTSTQHGGLAAVSRVVASINAERSRLAAAEKVAEAATRLAYHAKHSASCGCAIVRCSCGYRDSIDAVDEALADMDAIREGEE